jgi:hypothetical protein
MSSLDTVIASLAETRLTVAGLLRWLRLHGRLGPLVCEALVALFVQEQAQQAGLSATRVTSTRPGGARVSECSGWATRYGASCGGSLRSG